MLIKRVDARRVLAAAASGAVALGLALMPSASASGQASKVDRMAAGSELFLTSGAIPVHADGTTWYLTVDAYDFGSTFVYATLGHSSTGGYESHYWNVNGLASSSIRRTTSTSWKLAPTASSISPLFHMSLTFVSSKKAADACIKGTEETYTGSLKGTLKIATGLSKLGTIGSASLSFSSPNSLVVDSGCVQKTQRLLCAGGIDWNVFNSRGSFGASGSARPTAYVSIDRSVKLAHPANAYRGDDLYAPSPAPTISGNTAIVKTKSGTLFTGSLKLAASAAPGRHSASCWLRGVKHTETTETWSPISISKGALVAHTLVTGDIST